jgi:Ig-like domain from next to BRCA1 gene
MVSIQFKSLIIVILLLSSACASVNTVSTKKAAPTGEDSSLAQNTPTVEVSVPTNTMEPSSTPTLPPTATFTPESSLTNAAAIQSTPATPVATIATCKNQATLVRHLSFSDNSSIINNSYFNKAWRIKNTGTCTWTTAYAFVFSSGEQMNAPTETPLPREVPPGDTIDIQIAMKAPDVAHAYTGNWMLRDPNGVLFGTGEAADQPIAINILVKKYTEKDKFPSPECG